MGITLGADIADYALIGDLRTAALISSAGSIDWLCLPRFDAPAVCAALLGNAEHGHWSLAPVGGGPCTRRRYRPDTLILQSDWVTPSGAVRVTDFMPPTAAHPRLVRTVEGVSGVVTMRTSVAMMMGYGATTPALRACDGHVQITSDDDGADRGEGLWLESGVELQVHGGTYGGDFTVASGDRVSFTLHTAPPQHRVDVGVDNPDTWLVATQRFWTDWVSRCTYTGPWVAQVRRSLITLKALTHAPSGGVLAAATTSLPERIGGSRNWDYRFCWLRDAAFTLEAFLAAGYTEEAAAWRDWLLSAAADALYEMPIMYSIDGGRCLPETTLSWLPGHANSAPVRVGNQAATQQQNDVWGEVLAVLHTAHEAGVPRAIGEDELEDAMLSRLAASWDRTDHGLWEVRGPRQHFTHSKLMTWVGVDRVLRRQSPGTRPLAQERELRELRKTVHADLCDRGFDPAQGAFTQAYGSAHLDASLLLMPRYGFLPWTDPRVMGTVGAIQRYLSRDGLVLRYAVSDHTPNLDGVSGEEGAFLACSFWLADALHGMGRTAEATALFERLVSLCNDVGLLSEECDTVTGRHLGNTPQAFSHAGLVTTAVNLTRDPTPTPAVAAAAAAVAAGVAPAVPAWEDTAS